jgi:hypothetical protein
LTGLSFTVASVDPDCFCEPAEADVQQPINFNNASSEIGTVIVGIAPETTPRTGICKKEPCLANARQCSWDYEISFTMGGTWNSGTQWGVTGSQPGSGGSSDPGDNEFTIGIEVSSADCYDTAEPNYEVWERSTWTDQNGTFQTGPWGYVGEVTIDFQCGGCVIIVEPKF